MELRGLWRPGFGQVAGLAEIFLEVVEFRTAVLKRFDQLVIAQHLAQFVLVELPPSLWSMDVWIELPGGAVVRLPQGVSAEVMATAIHASRGIDVQERHLSG